ncbi:MAG: hypothetical protein PHN80_07715 [Hespellia sp.]|nr:hypothetical protein [Hespellia sp.]
MISERIRPGNPVFVFIALLTPWNLFNTYIDINGQQIIFSRYFQERKHRRKRKDVFSISEVIAIGWSSELGISMREAKAHGRSGTYAAQEIDFLLKSGEIIPLNVRPYTKNQCRRLLSLFPCEKKKRLSKALEL